MDTSNYEEHRQKPTGPVAAMARNTIAANLIMLLLIGGGLFSATHMQKEVFPQFALDMVSVSVVYPGAAPAEVETGIILPIEESIRGVDGIKEISSYAGEGYGSVDIELVSGTDRMKAFQDMDQAVNRIRTFPEDIERPQVSLQARTRDVMQIALFGDTEIWTLRQLAERLRIRLLSEKNITQVELGRVPDYVTHVEISDYVLRQYDLTPGQVARIIRQSSQDIPGGDLKTGTGEILLRMKERKQWAREFANIEIITSPSGSAITLGDIATITDGFEERGFHGQFNQKPSIDLEVYRAGDQSPLEIAETVSKVLAEFQDSLPPSVEYRIDSNRADDYQQRLSLLVENGVLAVFIVILILALFLEFRLAFWVMMGMVISFVGGMIFLPLIGLSINMISMFGFLVVLGIVVDDAIVVGENIFEHRQRGEGVVEAAISGATEMARPVTFSILTNIIAFVPLLFIPGTTGKFWWPLPAVVIVVLAISLFEALFILPAHLGHVPRKKEKKNPVLHRLSQWQASFSSAFVDFVNNRYGPFLSFTLHNRYLTMIVSLALLLVTGVYSYSDHMGMVMMPEVAADEIEAGVSLPESTTPEQAARVAAAITESTRRMFDKHNLYRVAEGIKTNVRGGNFIDVEIVMKPPDKRDMSAREVIELWRNEIGDIQGVDQISFEAERGPGGWKQDISVDLSHSDIRVLEKVSVDFFQRAQSFETTRDVNDNYNTGKARLDFELLPEGRSLGLTPEEVGRQVRDSFFGALALRQLRGTNEIELRVRLPESQRKDIHHLEDLVIRAPDGTRVPLLDVVRVREGEAFTGIHRRDGRRVITVSMDVDPPGAVNRVLDEIENQMLPALAADYPGTTWSFQGSQAEMRESTRMLWGGFGLAMLVIYTLLAIAFGDYIQPLIVMMAIPFGVVGAVIGHIILGYDLSLISMMGVIALSGVVVNDSLIMIDYANRKAQHESTFDAIFEAGLRRFRPIALTTLTTAGGLIPIILETSQQASYLIPMAISLGFGILFATAIILIIVPSLYLILVDIRHAFVNTVK